MLRRAARCNRAVHDDPGGEADHGRDRQDRGNAEHTDRFDSVEAAPVDRAGASLDERGADETAEQRVSRARRKTAPPGETVPRNRTGQRGAEDLDHLGRRDRDDARDRVRNRAPEQERAENVARRREQHRSTGTRGAGRDERRDRVRRVVNTIGEREGQRHPHRENKATAHQPDSRS